MDVSPAREPIRNPRRDAPEGIRLVPKDRPRPVDGTGARDIFASEEIGAGGRDARFWQYGVAGVRVGATKRSAPSPASGGQGAATDSGQVPFALQTFHV